MSNKLYTIKPLKWEKEGFEDYEIRYVARNTFGQFVVFRVTDEEAYDYNHHYWGYCFNDFYDEDQFECDSIADGKKKAFEFLKSRLLGCLDEVTVRAK